MLEFVMTLGGFAICVVSFLFNVKNYNNIKPYRTFK